MHVPSTPGLLTAYTLPAHYALLTATRFSTDGNLHYTYVAESTEDGVTTSTILGHGQKKTTLSGIILNKGDLKLNVIVADAFGAEGMTCSTTEDGVTTSTCPPGASLTVQAKEAFGAVTLSKTYRFSLTVTDLL